MVRCPSLKYKVKCNEGLGYAQGRFEHRILDATPQSWPVPRGSFDGAAYGSDIKGIMN